MPTRPGDRRGRRLLGGVLAFYLVLFLSRLGWHEWRDALRLGSGRAEVLHYEFVDIELRTRDPRLVERFARAAPRAQVFRDGSPVPTVGGISSVALAYDPGRRAWTGRWPCPWNAPDGVYELRLMGAPDLERRLRAAPFRIGRRRPAPLPPRFAVVTFESVAPLAALRVRAPDGSLKDWRGLLDWVEYVGADAFWMLGGQSPGRKPGEIWVSHNFPFFGRVAAECRRRGIQFGLYAMCYLTMSQERLPRYQYAREVEDSAPVWTRAISIRDPGRIVDVAQLLRRFRDIPGVDYVGLDYIRNALGGYELVDDFVAEFPGLALPSGWERLTEDDRMVYLARKKIMRRDRDFIDAWQWWRAHRVARIIRAIKDHIGDSKPLWAFTLTWDKGWHHGQDPVMFNDAGVDINALMLYEATEEQYGLILRDWRRYIRRADAQLIVGNVVDWPLHQRSPEGPGAFYRRTAQALDGIYADGPARGLFVHDLARALGGRLGPWSTRQWLDEARRAIRRLKETAEVARR